MSSQPDRLVGFRAAPQRFQLYRPTGIFSPHQLWGAIALPSLHLTCCMPWLDYRWPSRPLASRRPPSRLTKNTWAEKRHVSNAWILFHPAPVLVGKLSFLFGRLAAHSAFSFAGLLFHEVWGRFRNRSFRGRSEQSSFRPGLSQPVDGWTLGLTIMSCAQSESLYEGSGQALTRVGARKGRLFLGPNCPRSLCPHCPVCQLRK
jgi:hypothetical protein